MGRVEKIADSWLYCNLNSTTFLLCSLEKRVDEWRPRLWVGLVR